MFKPFLLVPPLALAMLFAVTPASALAQAGPEPVAARTDPSDVNVRVPQIEYRSTFTTYGAYADQEVKDWRESNDIVGRVGGWRAYAREAREQKPAANSSVAQASAGGADGAHKHH